MHGGNTVFVSPKYVLDHGSDAGVLYVNAPQSSVMSKWNDHGIEVLSTGYGPKITPQSGLEIVLSNDPTGCESIQDLRGRENVIIVVSKWTSKCSLLRRIKNIEASGAAAAIFVFESNFLYPIGQTDGVGTSKIKSKDGVGKIRISTSIRIFHSRINYDKKFWGSIITIHKIERRTAPHHWPFYTPRLSLEGEMERNIKIERTQQLAQR